MGKLDGKVALITGANRGIGRGIARGLAREGAALVLTARGRESLGDAAREMTSLGSDCLAVPADVTDEPQVEALFKQLTNRFDRLDLLVNNAGAFDGGPLDELGTAAWD